MQEALCQQDDTPDPSVFRNAIGAFATGVAVVTTQWDGELHGMTMNSLTSVSLDPCMLLICPKSGSTTGQAILSRGAFAVNVLTRDQRVLSERFVGALQDRFGDLDIAYGPEGLPLLPGCGAHLCCAVESTQAAGDHDIVLGRVLWCRSGEGEPLVFHRGAFGAFRAE